MSGRFRRPDEAFLCIRMRDGWLVCAVSGELMAFWGVFGVIDLLVGSLRRAGMWLAWRWGGILLWMMCGYGSIRFEDYLLVAAIFVVSILMYK